MKQGGPLKRKTPLKSNTRLRSNTPLKASKRLSKASNGKKGKKPRQASLRLIQDKIWKLLRAKADKQFPPHCYTCNAQNLEGSNKQLGHMWARASVGAYLKYDMRILRWQCMRCNIHFGGQGAIYYKRMLEEIGEESMKQLEQDRNVTVNARDHYTKLLEELQQEI